jgi:hypothetical protein
LVGIEPSLVQLGPHRTTPGEHADQTYLVESSVQFHG